MSQNDDASVYTECDAFIEEYKYSSVPEHQKQVATAYIAKGVQRLLDGQFTQDGVAEPLIEQAIANFNAVINLYKTTEDVAVQTSVAEALSHKAQTYRMLLKTKEQEECYNELMHLYMGSQEEAVQEFVAEALLSKGILLGKQGDNEAELQHYEVLIKLYHRSTSIRLNKAIAKTFFNKGAVLADQNKVKEALQAFTYLAKRYKHDANPTLQKVVVAARKKIALYKKIDKNQIKMGAKL